MSESMYLKQLLARAGKNLKTIVLPESEDNRVLEAAHFAATAKAARIIILGRFDQVAEYYRAKGWNIDDAGRFAAAMSTLKIEAIGPFSGTVDDIRRCMETAECAYPCIS